MNSKGLVLVSLFFSISVSLLGSLIQFLGFANHPEDDFQTYFISSTNLHVYMKWYEIDMKLDNL